MLIEDFTRPLFLIFGYVKNINRFDVPLSHFLYFTPLMAQLFNQAIDSLLETDDLGCHLFFFPLLIIADLLTVSFALKILRKNIGCG